MSSLKAAKVLVARLKEKDSELDANIMHACMCLCVCVCEAGQLFGDILVCVRV